MLHPRVGVDLLGGRRIEAGAAGEDEAPAVGDPEVDRARLEAVGAAEQVLGGVDDVVGDSQRPRDDVGRAAGKDRDRDVGPGEAVGDLVQGAVPAEGDDDVVAAVDRLAADLGRVVLGLGRDRLDLVAALERVDDEALEPVGDRRRVGVDDDQHPPLRRAGVARRLRLDVGHGQGRGGSAHGPFIPEWRSRLRPAPIRFAGVRLNPGWS